MAAQRGEARRRRVRSRNLVTTDSADRPEPRRGPARRVVGLAIRTTNAEEMVTESARIPGLWGRFMGEGWFARLEQLGAVGPVIAVYSDYASDLNGAYSLLAGREVVPGLALAAGVSAVDVPPGDFLVFRFRGPMPAVVIAGWQRVWKFFDRADGARRAYTTDVEVYDADGAGLAIWIAVRK